jgi:hypothetical protein
MKVAQSGESMKTALAPSCRGLGGYNGCDGQEADFDYSLFLSLSLSSLSLSLFLSLSLSLSGCTVSNWQVADLDFEDEAHNSWSLEQPLTAKQFGALQMAILSQLSSHRKLKHEARSQLSKASHLW